MHVRATKYKLHRFGSSAYKCNTLTFVLKLALHIIKINGKIHANNLNLKFFYLQKHKTSNKNTDQRD